MNTDILLAENNNLYVFDEKTGRYIEWTDMIMNSEYNWVSFYNPPSDVDTSSVCDNCYCELLKCWKYCPMCGTTIGIYAPPSLMIKDVIRFKILPNGHYKAVITFVDELYGYKYSWNLILDKNGHVIRKAFVDP